jgi:hypothetical protein
VFKPVKYPLGSVMVKRGVKYLRMTDETGRHVWVPFPENDKD